jgi:hypothetical protein
MMNKANRWIVLVVIAALLELGLQTFMKKAFGPYVSPVVMLLSGIAVGVGFIAFFFGREVRMASGNFDRKKIFAIGLPALAGIVAAAVFLNIEIGKHPIPDFYNSSGSDVIPQIGILVDRLLTGKFPYAWIMDEDWSFSHHLYPTYLPLQWMPFVLPELIGIDYRWFALIILTLAFLWYERRLGSLELPAWKIALMALFPFAMLLFYQIFDNEGMFRYSVETLIAGYYFFLALSLFTSSNWIRGLALSLCLLSRYSVVLWAPLFLLVVFFEEKKKNAFQITAILAAMALAVYVIPFFSKDTSIFMNGYNYHSHGAVQAWRVFEWQNPDEPPFALYKGLGFGIFFYEGMDGSTADKVLAYRKFHLAASLLTVIGLGLLYFFWMKKNIDYRIFLLASLKIYLVIFYNFIQIPFGYLYFVPTFLSAPIILMMVGNGEGSSSRQ